MAAVEALVKKFVPSDWAEDLHPRVSDLTRETLRRTLTVFMGTGTINTLVLALLSIVAELKQKVSNLTDKRYLSAVGSGLRYARAPRQFRVRAAKFF